MVINVLALVDLTWNDPPCMILSEGNISLKISVLTLCYICLLLHGCNCAILSHSICA